MDNELNDNLYIGMARGDGRHREIFVRALLEWSRKYEEGFITTTSQLDTYTNPFYHYDTPPEIVFKNGSYIKVLEHNEKLKVLRDKRIEEADKRVAREFFNGLEVVRGESDVV